jgi:hypothetical protein
VVIVVCILSVFDLQSTAAETIRHVSGAASVYPWNGTITGSSAICAAKYFVSYVRTPDKDLATIFTSWQRGSERR